MEVATAAYEVYAWYEHSPRLQRNLLFMIKRAQKPLEFRSKPFFGFTFASFNSVSPRLSSWDIQEPYVYILYSLQILSTSYSYFALLRTMND